MVPKAPPYWLQQSLRFLKIGRNIIINLTRLIIERVRQMERRRALSYTFALMMIFSFGAGMFFEWSSSPLAASVGDERSRVQVLSAHDVMGPARSAADLDPFAVFMNLLDAERATAPANESADAYAARKAKLKSYLSSKGSPIAKEDKALDTLLGAKNMKMILAISWVESGLCKNQVDNNCSGIGVSPDHPSWQRYRNFSDWVISLDKLLERRYKGWTPEEMRGVYVQPGSENWVDGAEQILSDLKQAGIE